MSWAETSSNSLPDYGLCRSEETCECSMVSMWRQGVTTSALYIRLAQGLAHCGMCSSISSEHSRWQKQPVCFKSRMGNSLLNWRVSVLNPTVSFCVHCGAPGHAFLLGTLWGNSMMFLILIDEVKHVGRLPSLNSVLGKSITSHSKRLCPAWWHLSFVTETRMDVSNALTSCHVHCQIRSKSRPSNG